MRKISMKRRGRPSKAETREEKDDFEEVSNGDVTDKNTDRKRRTKTRNAAEENGKDSANSEKDDESSGEGSEEPEPKKKRGSKKPAEAEEDKGSDESETEQESKKKKSNKKASNTNKTAAKEDEDDDDEPEVEYEVEAIVDDKKIRNTVQYLIRWKGYSSKEDTWEPEKTLNCTDLLQKYKEAKAKNKKKADEAEEDEEDDGKEYEVDRILDVYFKKSGKREFLVVWKGYSPQESTWEPEENMDCPDIIARFMNKVERAKTIDARDLRVYRAPTERFTLTPKDTGRRLSKRNSNKQRVRYADCE